MQVRVGYFAANTGTIAAHLRTNSATLMRNAGENLGNLVFWHAVRRMFDNDCGRPVRVGKTNPSGLY